MTRAVTAAGLHEVSGEWDKLFAAGPGFQSSRAWFEATVEAALPPGCRAEFLLCRDDGRPAAILPLLLGPEGQARGLSTVYTCLFQPLLAPNLSDPAIRRVGEVLGGHCRRWPTLVLDALDPRWPGLPPLLAGLRDGGLLARRFEHFGNWHQPVAGCGWQNYLAARPGRLRELIRRKTRACARDRRVRIELVRGGRGLERAMAAYQDVYGRSWKPREAAPGFTAALLPRAAAAGVLRLGILWSGAQAVAAQYWTVDWTAAGGSATVLKLAHDDAWRPLSPGTVLTGHMIQGLLAEGVTEIDFGRGDDAYKAAWSAMRRRRVGVLLANPRDPRALLALARHSAGAALRGTLRRVA